MTDEKKHIFAYLVGSVQQELCSVFTQSNFFPRRLEDCLVANKVWKMTDLSKGRSA